MHHTVKIPDFQRFLGFCFIAFLLPITISCQKTRLVAFLDKQVFETSGLTIVRGLLITHNDSGDKAFLYSLNTLDGKVKFRVKVKGANHIDWEDICHDETHIYIGDFGNNYGDRKDLTIYRISIRDFLNHPGGEVFADVIHFKYAEQRDFSRRKHKHNFDAETLVAFRNSLYIFTKNWENLKTYIYRLPKVPGSYNISRIDSLDVGVLVTGGVYSDDEKCFKFTGYHNFMPYLITLKNVKDGAFSSGQIYKSKLLVSGSIQIEGITKEPSGQYFISGEEDVTGHPASLYELCPGGLTTSSACEKDDLSLFSIRLKKFWW